MKRVLKTKPTIEFEINIDIVSSSMFSVLSSQSVDLSDTEYELFKDSLIAQFLQKNYGKVNNPLYTHSSNVPGSYSDYITFTKLLDAVYVVVVVNIRLSDHATPPNIKNGSVTKTGEDKRAGYVARLSNDIAGKLSKESAYNVDAVPFPIDITFNDEIDESGKVVKKHFNSYFSAELYINTELRKIESAINEYLEEQS